ncbi:AAA family ATPase [Brevibacillus choshinensis]|uniref:ATP-binding protein n=1 Tax=Brevibacillus choshinensis TaxID=54911 RepID=A0ABX7FUI9_BRECH|nr:ATP-binding protein [Brevibacillus choshinensis]QRG68650.1 ATP-binding protein [Brevibacillus choshinensis]
MNPTQTVRSEERGKLFIGRKKERDLLEEWLDDPEAPLRIFSVTGMGGIGKSSLIAEMLHQAREKKVLGLWLDGRSCVQTPVGFLEYIQAAVSLEGVGRGLTNPLEPLANAGPERRAVLCIDNVESLSLLEGWLLEAFLPKLSDSGVLVILASRSALSPAWKTHPVWGRHLKQLPLVHFSHEEAMAYIRSAGPFPKEMAKEMAMSTDGHPLALALMVEAALRQNRLSAEDKQIVSQTISAHILRELTLAELQPMVDVLVILQFANQEMLSLVLNQTITLHQYQLLKGLSFIRSTPDGLSLHDLARMHLLRDFRQREPQRLQALRAKAGAILHHQLKVAKPEKKRMITSQMLQLGKDSLPLHRLYADLSVDSHISPLEPIQPSDMPVLSDLLEQWCEYSVDPRQIPIYQEFLSELAIRFPESISVLRGADGLPVGMFLLVLLHRETSLFLKRFFPAELAECCEPEELMCEYDQADTYYPVLVAATTQLPGFTREELVGLLMLDRLSLLGEGMRAVLVATNADLKVFLQQLGFLLRPTRSRDCDTSYAKADVLELDLRNGQAGDWIMSFFPEMPRSSMTLPTPKDLTKKAVRKLLASLQAPAELQAYVPCFPEIENGAQLHQHIVSLLFDETTPLSHADRSLLHAAYLHHPQNAIAAAKSVNMSRATFYRHVGSAVSNFAEVLRTWGASENKE